jgi:hypothetical protein
MNFKIKNKHQEGSYEVYPITLSAAFASPETIPLHIYVWKAITRRNIQKFN